MTNEEVLYTVQDTAVMMLIQEPFYGHIIAGIIRKLAKDDKQKEVTQIESLGMTTVAISVISESWLKLSKPDRVKRMKHEVMHYIFMHPWAERPSDIGLFYTSCDLSANKYAHDTLSLSLHNFKSLIGDHFPKTELFVEDGWTDIYKSIKDLAKYVDDGLSPQEKEFYTELAAKGEFWNKDQLTEAIFYLPKSSKGSMNLSEVADMVRQMKMPGSGGSGEEGEFTEEEIAEAIKSLAEQPSDPWEEVAEGTSDLGAKELVKNALKDAKGRGDIPGELTNYVNAFLAPPKLDWKQELRRFTSLAGNVVAKTTMTRRSKRFGTFPALKIRKTQRLAIIVDTSGSVSDDEFTAFYSELRGILQDNCEVVFIQADAGVDRVDVYNKRLPENMRIMREGYGGTAFGPALYFVRTQGKESDKFKPIGKVDGTIYMTDGYAPAPKHGDYPPGKMMWITTQKPIESMKSEGFEGHIVDLEIDRKR